MKATILVLVLITPSLLAVEFELAFDGVPEVIAGQPGEVKTFDAYVTLTTRDNSSPDGAQGWSVLMHVTGGVFKQISLAGVVVSTRFDQDGDDPDEDGKDIDGNPATPIMDQFDLDLYQAGFKVAQLQQSKTCAVTALVLHQTQKMVLQPNGTQRIARLTVEATVPGEDCTLLTLDFLNCYRGGGSQPISNVITFAGASQRPKETATTVPICRAQFRRGDFNADGRVDISDAIAGLGNLFLGSAGTPCRSAADSNGDDRVDITDPIILLLDLFRPDYSSSLPAPGPFACGIGVRGDPLGCESYPSCP